MGFGGCTESQGVASDFIPIVSDQRARLGQVRTEGYQVASWSQSALQAGTRSLIYHLLQESSMDTTLPVASWQSQLTHPQQPQVREMWQRREAELTDPQSLGGGGGGRALEPQTSPWFPGFSPSLGFPGAS